MASMPSHILYLRISRMLRIGCMSEKINVYLFSDVHYTISSNRLDYDKGLISRLFIEIFCRYSFSFKMLAKFGIPYSCELMSYVHHI